MLCKLRYARKNVVATYEFRRQLQHFCICFYDIKLNQYWTMIDYYTPTRILKLWTFIKGETNRVKYSSQHDQIGCNWWKLKLVKVYEKSFMKNSRWGAVFLKVFFFMCLIIYASKLTCRLKFVSQDQNYIPLKTNCFIMM